MDCRWHLILSMNTGVGPTPDVNELSPLLDRLPPGVTILKLLADAGYGSEGNHQLVREEHGIQSVMPATHGRPSKHGKPPTGRWRRLMQRRLRTKRGRKASGYTQRWQVETVVSMLKRNLGGVTRHARNRQMRLLAVAHNIMVVLFKTELCDGAVMVLIFKAEVVYGAVAVRFPV